MEEFGLALRGAQVLRPWLEQAAAGHRRNDPAALAEQISSLLPDVDRAVLTDEFGRDLAACVAAGLSGGVDGWLDDDLAFARPWGFSTDEITVPAFVWHGSADLMVPFSHGRWLARRIPGVAAHLEEGQGHLSISVGSFGRIVAELVRAL